MDETDYFFILAIYNPKINFFNFILILGLNLPKAFEDTFDDSTKFLFSFSKLLRTGSHF